ncbi:MAG: hypothetical protein JO090_03515, partial [Rhizobacter sp.]|nr:hypothetical protein [Rhizobacter sp.]
MRSPIGLSLFVAPESTCDCTRSLSDKTASSGQKALTPRQPRAIMASVDGRPSDDQRRRAALDAFGADPFASTAFSDLTRMAADLLETPMAAISVID